MTQPTLTGNAVNTLAGQLASSESLPQIEAIEGSILETQQMMNEVTFDNQQVLQNVNLITDAAIARLNQAGLTSEVHLKDRGNQNIFNCFEELRRIIHQQDLYSFKSDKPVSMQLPLQNLITISLIIKLFSNPNISDSLLEDMLNPQTLLHIYISKDSPCITGTGIDSPRARWEDMFPVDKTGVVHSSLLSQFLPTLKLIDLKAERTNNTTRRTVQISQLIRNLHTSFFFEKDRNRLVEDISTTDSNFLY
jgi:hypothetical protein